MSLKSKIGDFFSNLSEKIKELFWTVVVGIGCFFVFGILTLITHSDSFFTSLLVASGVNIIAVILLRMIGKNGGFLGKLLFTILFALTTVCAIFIFIDGNATLLQDDLTALNFSGEIALFMAPSIVTFMYVLTNKTGFMEELHKFFAIPAGLLAQGIASLIVGLMGVNIGAVIVSGIVGLLFVAGVVLFWVFKGYPYEDEDKGWSGFSGNHSHSTSSQSTYNPPKPKPVENTQPQPRDSRDTGGGDVLAKEAVYIDSRLSGDVSFRNGYFKVRVSHVMYSSSVEFTITVCDRKSSLFWACKSESDFEHTADSIKSTLSKLTEDIKRQFREAYRKVEKNYCDLPDMEVIVITEPIKD